MHHFFRALTALAFVTIATTAPAHEITAPGLEIMHPWIALPPASAPTAAGYFSVTNTGTVPERLLGVESDLANMVMLHESRVDAAGISTMVHLEAVDIAPGETITFAPGGKHVMFMGLKAPLADSTMEPGALIFEHAGRVPVDFVVTAETSGAMHADHATPTKP